VNGTPITDERALRDGDIVSIASHSIKFEVA
jgi:pSer/pThr/pTyr-binding forkhead associated (FHA) protein